jgi:hypothetical protein
MKIYQLKYLKYFEGINKKVDLWGLGDWGLGPIPNPHPQSPIPVF